MIPPTYFLGSSIPRVSKPLRHRKRCCRYLFLLRLSQAHQPSLHPMPKFLRNHEPLPSNHVIHDPLQTIGPSFATFDINPLPNVRMLKSFDLILPNVCIPTYNGSHSHSVHLQSTQQAFAFSEFNRFYPLILNSGASISITPVLSDFTNGIHSPPFSSVHGINSTNKVEGTGNVT